MDQVFHFSSGEEQVLPDAQNGHASLGTNTTLPQRQGVMAAPGSAAAQGRALYAPALRSGAASVSVVIPLLNEVDSLDDLYRRLKAALNDCAPAHEIIFIDDGSRDGSFDKLQGFWRHDPNVSVIRFRRNFGKAAALSAGFTRVQGDLVVMMDADLQDQPEQLPRLIAKLDEGYDLVTGWKEKRHDPLNKTMPSKVFNGTVSRYYNLDIHDFNCGFKIMRAAVAQDLRLYGDLHRFIPVLAAERGFRVTECAVEHAPRVHGVSKYGAKRLITGLLDFIATILTTRFMQKPMQFFGGIGLSVSALGILMALYLGVETLFGQGGHLRPLWVVMSVLLLGGVQIACTGLLAEMMTNQTHRSGNPYFITESLPARAEKITVTAKTPKINGYSFAGEAPVG
jgi:hypothetical protein